MTRSVALMMRNISKSFGGVAVLDGGDTATVCMGAELPHASMKEVAKSRRMR